MQSMKEKQAGAFKVLKDEFGYKNVMSAPKLQKVIVSVGTGSGMKRDRNKNTFVSDRLMKITGQKPAIRGSKQSIASFKTRQGDPVGVIVTLRGNRMYEFLDKLVHIALPRTKDFRGITRSSANSLGNMSIGIKEHTIFPETGDEEIVNVFGMSITIVTTAKTRPEAIAFFEYLGFPLKKEDEKKKPRSRKKRGK
jgi:large subunit ribosomal protein L5